MHEQITTKISRLATIAGAALFVAVVVGGCAGDDSRQGSETPPPASSPRPTRSVVNPQPANLEKFRNKCLNDAGQYLKGQLDYEPSLNVVEGRTTDYSAAVDVRAHPDPPDQVLGTSGATGETVILICKVSARLRSVGTGLDVTLGGDDGSTAGANTWQSTRIDTNIGTVSWDWDVKPTTAGDKALVLEIRPVVDYNGQEVLASTDTFSRNIMVHVKSSPLDKTSDWFRLSWPKIAGIAATLSAAYFSIRAFLRKARPAPAKDVSGARPESGSSSVAGQSPSAEGPT